MCDIFCCLSHFRASCEYLDQKEGARAKSANAEQLCHNPQRRTGNEYGQIRLPFCVELSRARQERDCSDDCEAERFDAGRNGTAAPSGFEEHAEHSLH